MTDWQKKIDALFGSDAMPSRDQLVVMDGFDELDKEDALALFLGKTQADIYQGIKSGKFANSSAMEDLCVMEPPAFKYYLAPYLTYLVCDVAGDPNDDEVVHFLFFYLREYTRRRALPLDRGQRQFLLYLVRDYLERARLGEKGLRAWRSDLIANLDYLAEAFGASA